MTYDYTRGLLTKLTRNTNGQNQVYNLSYDTLGNLTKMQVGSRTLMTYTYGAKNALWSVKPTATERIRSTNTTAGTCEPDQHVGRRYVHVPVHRRRPAV